MPKHHRSGRIWHWPLFQWLTGERTGLSGAELFPARCAVTLAVAAASYVLLERPQPDFDAYLRKELDLALDIVTDRGARPVLLTAPYTRRAERPDGGLWPGDQPQRVDAWNVLPRAAAESHGATVIDLNRRVCPDGRFTWRVDGIRVRSDGLHFTPQGVRQVIAPWLLPQPARLAVHRPERPDR